MATKGGLGNRGLSALFDDNETNVEVIVPDTQTNEVDITLIDRNPNQPRQTFDEDSLNLSVNCLIIIIAKKKILSRTSHPAFYFA